MTRESQVANVRASTAAARCASLNAGGTHSLLPNNGEKQIDQGANADHLAYHVVLIRQDFVSSFPESSSDDTEVE